MREEPPKWIEGYVKPRVVSEKKTSLLTGTRKLAVREQARLQTFPDWFEFFG